MGDHSMGAWSSQRTLLFAAIRLVEEWLARWEIQLPKPLVRAIQSSLAKGRSLLEESCGPESSNRWWLMRTVAKAESREEFSEVLQGFVESVGSFVESVSEQLGQDANSGQDGAGPSSVMSVEAKGITQRLRSMLLGQLQDASAKDHQDLISRLEGLCVQEGPDSPAASHASEEDVRIAGFLLERFKHKSGLEVHSPSLIYVEGIGEGAYGSVSKATWQGLTIAVKVYSSREVFKLEFDNMVGLSHMNIIRIIGYYIDMERGRKPCLLMECMKGDLEKLINNQELPLDVSIEILLQVSKGMAYLHEKQIVHRDLKPAKILLDCGQYGVSEYFTAKIADFGTARTNFDTAKLSHATARVGTSFYRAPEVLNDGDGTVPYSKKVDVYSFAMVCYNVLTGCTPRIQSAQDAKSGTRPELLPSSRCPLALVCLIKRCWDRDATKRPSFNEICDFLGVVKSLVLMSKSSGELTLSAGIVDKAVGTLVGFLGKEWLFEEAVTGSIAAFLPWLSRCEPEYCDLLLRIGNRLANWKGPEHDYENAFQFFKYAAEKGNKGEALWRMGKIAEERGVAVPARDPEELAFEFYKRAANEGEDVNAMVEVGRCLRKGCGVQIDKGIGFLYFEKAKAEQIRSGRTLPCVAELIDVCMSGNNAYDANRASDRLWDLSIEYLRYGGKLVAGPGCINVEKIVQVLPRPDVPEYPCKKILVDCLRKMVVHDGEARATLVYTEGLVTMMKFLSKHSSWDLNPRISDREKRSSFMIRRAVHAFLCSFVEAKEESTAAMAVASAVNEGAIRHLARDFVELANQSHGVQGVNALINSRRRKIWLEQAGNEDVASFLATLDLQYNRH